MSEVRPIQMIVIICEVKMSNVEKIEQRTDWHLFSTDMEHIFSLLLQDMFRPWLRSKHFYVILLGHKYVKK